MIRLREVWRQLAARHWPVAVLLAVLFIGDDVATHGFDVPGRGWVIAGVLAVCGLALLTVKWPVTGGTAVSAVVLAWSGVLRLVGAEVEGPLGPVLISEVGAAMVVTVAVFRFASAGVAIGVVGLLVACYAGALVLRLQPLLPDGSRPTTWHSGDSLLVWAFLLGLCVAMGRYLRGRDDDQAKAMRLAVAAVQQRERVSLARELHDLVAHHVGIMVVQAQAAQAVAGTRPGAAMEVLPVIETAGADALAAMRRLVGALRDDSRDGDEHGGTLAQTSDLVADLHAIVTPRGGGPPVRLDVVLGVPVPAEVSASVLRLVQESVTNARRHAPGAREIAVSVQTDGGLVRIQVRDDGRAAAASTAKDGGYGLIGMQERVQLLGGRFWAGRAPDGGWQVWAEVPLRESGR